METLTSDEKEIINCWRKHYMTLLDGRECNHNQMEQIDENLEDTRYKLDENFLPSWADVSEAIKQLKNKRSPGPDNLNAELIKVAEPIILETIYHIIIQTWKTEKLPPEWEEGIICPIYKKGDPTKCTNYRGLTQHNL